MAVGNELQSVVDFVKTMYPKAKIIKQNVPSTPSANTFIVRLLTSDTESETLYHMRRNRDYQIVYYGTTVEDVLTKIDVLERKAMNNLLIPITGSLRYIRVEGFSSSMPFKTESGVDVAIGVLQTTIREARDQKTYDKIMHVYARIER
ncbi:hypothetical protein [Aneurinibacillus aneurinilyticus]|uniref:hypothetical protein n=1 Tax=Aneurinibacillus aneurinilyticus TaxID=1391 RepID=UPI00366EA079